MIKVPYVGFRQQYLENRQTITEAIESVFARGDFILGRDVEEFEKEFAALCGVKYAIGVANGTDSLIIALRVLGIGPGDEVITPPNSWVSSTSAIALVGAKPVFVDVCDDQNMNPQQIEGAITQHTKAIIPVHLTGRCARMPEIIEVARKHGLFVIEDAAQAVGAKICSSMAGSMGDINSFSLHPLKNLNAAGDAGIITTDSADYANKVRMYRNHGMRNRDEIDFWGYNSRLDSLQAALLRSRMKDLLPTIQKRRDTACKYVEGLKDLVQCPIEAKDEFHTYHVFVIQTDRRDDLQKYLFNEGIETKIHYPIPIHLQRAAEYLGHRPGSFPMVEKQAQRILSLPIHQYLTDDQVEYVVDRIRIYFRR